MDQTALTGQILTPAGWVAGTIRYTAQIIGVEPGSAPDDRFILPGFVDLHVHGGHGADCMDGANSVRRMAQFHARHGTTSLLATTVTAPAADLRRAMAGIAKAMEEPGPGARVIGAHLEGPFISPDALGAQPPFAIPPDLALLEELAALAPIRVATYAPEIDPDGALLAAFRRLGTRAQIGHTTCSYRQARAAWPRAPAASPICSTPCPACIIGAPGPPARRWRWPNPPRSSSTCTMSRRERPGGVARHPATCIASPTPWPPPACPTASTIWAPTPSPSAATWSASPTAASPAAC